MNAEGSEKTTPSFATDLTGAPRVGSDEFFYDIFGINIKGLKSIWTLLKRRADMGRGFRNTPSATRRDRCGKGGTRGHAINEVNFRKLV